jgi:hypothetical protein
MVTTIGRKMPGGALMGHPPPGSAMQVDVRSRSQALFGGCPAGWCGWTDGHRILPNPPGSALASDCHRHLCQTSCQRLSRWTTSLLVCRGGGGWCWGTGQRRPQRATEIAADLPRIERSSRISVAMTASLLLGCGDNLVWPHSSSRAPVHMVQRSRPLGSVAFVSASLCHLDPAEIMAPPQ